jgi:hypothetical protein
VRDAATAKGAEYGHPHKDQPSGTPGPGGLMRPISKVVARRAAIAAVIVTLAVPFAGASTREARDPGFDGPRRRLVKIIRIVKKIVTTLDDWSWPKP